MTKPFAWSYSALGSFENCPRQHNEVKIAKNFAEVQGPEMLWGNRVHKALENRIKGVGGPLSAEMPYEPIIQAIMKMAEGGMIEAEQRGALTRNYQPTTFFGKDVWVRIITDFTIVKKNNAFVGDWKTGKPTPASAQLKLCAASTFHHISYVDRVTTAFVWLKVLSELMAAGKSVEEAMNDPRVITSETYHRSDLPDIWQEFAPRVTRMERAIEQGNFPPRPSGLCRAHCPVTSCEHNGKFRG